jgi:hypothetical protein
MLSSHVDTSEALSLSVSGTRIDIFECAIVEADPIVADMDFLARHVVTSSSAPWRKEATS